MGLSSRDRILRTIAREPTDYVPLCVLLWAGLSKRCSSTRDFVERQLELGLDVLVPLPSLNSGPPLGVDREVWKEKAEPYDLLHKVYRTPAGDLETTVALTPDWPHGEDIPLLSDFNIPRARKFLVTDEADLGPLQCLLSGPGDEARRRFRQEAQQRRKIAVEHALALATPLARLADTACWLCGPVQFATWAIERPDFLRRLLDVLSRWERGRREAELEAAPDIVIRAEWYASPFLSPSLFGQFLGSAIRQDVELAHAAGAKYCYVGTANMMPFLGALMELGVDVVYGLDPIEGRWDFARAKEQCRGRMALWGGMNGYLQVVRGGRAEIEEAVRNALDALAPGGGFILCPVDDIGLTGTDQDSDATWNRTWQNVSHMVNAWKKLR